MAHADEIQALEQRALDALGEVADLKSLVSWKTSYLGKQGEATLASRGLGGLPSEERREAGQRVNALRAALDAAFDDAERRLKAAALSDELESDQVDVTMPGRAPNVGWLHPITLATRRIVEIFGEMGFQVWESREVELDEYNFTLLNFKDDHPARDMQDTFYIDTPPDSPKVVLRTHTSPGQIHAMRRYAPEPVRVLLPGKCYRNEQVTARSEFQFNQFEFMAVGRNITLGDLKGTLDTFAERMFGKGTHTRLRPSYFPFTEPSAEMDISCFICGGTGCRMCKYSGWLEIGGCGMVHPTVLRNGGYDPAVFSGFAGGFGIERTAILKYGIDDIRWFNSGDERFIEQFG